MNICVIAGMIDAKLHSKIAPLQAIEEVSNIYLVRRKFFQSSKIICHSPPKAFSSQLILAEMWRLITLFYIVLTKRPKIIIAFGIIPHGIYAWWIGTLFRIPVVQHVMGKNDLRLNFNDPFGQYFTLSAIKGGTRIAVRGKNMKKWLVVKGVPSDRIFIQHNIHDFERFKPSNQKKTPQYDLIYVGILEAYKRVDIMIDAMKELHDRGCRCSLLIVGDGSKRSDIEHLVERYKLSQFVHFAGDVNFEALPQLYQSARAFIMTSEGEGLPMAMIEAMSCGLPVIVSADADIEEVAKNGINAITVKPIKKELFATAVMKLLNNSVLYDELKKATIQFRQKNEIPYSLPFQTELWEKQLHAAIH